MSAVGISSYSSIPIPRKEDRSLLTEGSEKLTSRKVHELVAKIFAVIGTVALGLTFYAAFGLIAAPVTVITVFSIASFVTVASIAVIFAALYFRPSEKQEELQKPTSSDIGSNSFQEVDELSKSLPDSVSSVFNGECLQMQWRDRSFTSEEFGHKAFFDHLGVSLNARDWTQKILEETSSLSISQIAKKWPELFSKGVLQKADVLERLENEIISAMSFEQMTHDYPELFFEMGFLTRETPGLNRLVQKYIYSHRELLLEHVKDSTIRLIVTYGLLSPAFQKRIEETQQAVQKENLLFLKNKTNVQTDFAKNFQPLERNYQYSSKELKLKIDSLKMIEDLERKLANIQAQIKRLEGTSDPDLAELNRMQKNVKALTEEIQKREKQAKAIFEPYSQELARLKEWRSYRDLDVSQLKQQIREAAIALDRATAPVQGLGAAFRALSRGDKQKKHLAVLEQKLATKTKVDTYGIDFQQGERRLKELSQKTLQAEQIQLGLPALKTQLASEKRKIAVLEQEKLAYQNLIQLKGEKKALLETIRNMPFSSQFFLFGSTGIRRDLETKQREIDVKFFEGKGDLEGQRRRMLENEECRHENALRSLVNNLETFS